ncbi:MAG: hypothetical protein WD078_14695, partial [Woeseia sp.]
MTVIAGLQGAAIRRCERTARGNLVPIGRVSVHTRSPRRYAPRDDDSVVASAQRAAISCRLAESV